MAELVEIPEMLNTLDSDVNQVLLAKAFGSGSHRATLEAWERLNDNWRKAYGPVPATIGRYGMAPEDGKLEGDGCTPRGVYDLGLVFGSEPSVNSAMPYRQISKEDCWVDDPNSPQYNRWVRGVPQGASWERMLRPDGLYRYGIVVEYNTNPVVAGKGSAIFIHLWRGPGEPTAGCLALAEENLLWLLAWLKPELRPVVAFCTQ